MKISLLEHILARLSALNVVGSYEGRILALEFNGIKSKFRLDEEFEDEFQEYIKIGDTHFDENDLTYVYGNNLDVPLVKLDAHVFRDDEYDFQDKSGDTVVIRRASFNYMFGYFDSIAYDSYFASFVTRKLSDPPGYARSLLSLFRRPPVATYSSLLAVSPGAMRPKGFEKIRSCLFKMAVESHVCFEFYVKPRKVLGRELDQPNEMDDGIPGLIYEPALSNYYMVGRASPFASQSFLAYYNVLEYYFLRVSEGALHDRLRALLNAPSFNTTPDGIDRAISLVRKHAGYDDETEMLRKVLAKFVSEDDFIAFIISSEKFLSDKIFTKKRNIFGEILEINPKEGHAISNAAKLLKHIRNAIVHSSDKYTRDECHIPLTESEDIVRQYIPLVKYFSEQVIYGTAKPHNKYI